MISLLFILLLKKLVKIQIDGQYTGDKIILLKIRMKSLWKLQIFTLLVSLFVITVGTNFV